MKVVASSLGAWRGLEQREGSQVRHGLTFPLMVVRAIGASHGLEMVPVGSERGLPRDTDAVFVSVLDSSTMAASGKHFARWMLPLRRSDRDCSMPMVWAGGQGLRNPLPYAPIADLMVLGDAEEPLPRLLELWHCHGNTAAFLQEAAGVPGVFVPAVHDRRHDCITMSFAEDIGISLRQDLRVSLDRSRRLEIARGCPFRCPYCSLGWRVPYRENSTAIILDVLRECPKRVHLQAGDAESHSGIIQLRAALRSRGHSDLSWTGRLDTIIKRLQADGSKVPPQKRYAVGIEGVSYRLRRALGKATLTDTNLLEWSNELFDRIGDASTGRMCWHLIGGLPTERPVDDGMELVVVLKKLNAARFNRSPKNLGIHWQPFQPLPGTPMQWCSAGSVSHTSVAVLSDAERLPFVRVQQVVGRTMPMAQITTILSRSDERGADLIEAMSSKRLVTPLEAEQLCGIGPGTLTVEHPLPWEFVRGTTSTAELQRIHARVMELLEQTTKAPISRS